MIPKETGRKVQHPARHGLQRAGALPDFVDLVENAFAALVNQCPDLGDVEAARGAIQRPRAKPVLQCTNMLADRCLR